MFSSALAPALAQQDMRGLYLNKAGAVHEGEAIFFLTSKWAVYAQKDLTLRDCFSARALEKPELSAVRHLRVVKLVACAT